MTVTMLPYCNESKFEAVVKMIRFDIFMLKYDMLKKSDVISKQTED